MNSTTKCNRLIRAQVDVKTSSLFITVSEVIRGERQENPERTRYSTNLFTEVFHKMMKQRNQAATEGLKIKFRDRIAGWLIYHITPLAVKLITAGKPWAIETRMAYFWVCLKRTSKRVKVGYADMLSKIISKEAQANESSR